MAEHDPHPNAFSYTINDACRMTGLSRGTIYNLAKAGRLRIVHVVGRSLVDGDSLRSLIGIPTPKPTPKDGLDAGDQGLSTANKRKRQAVAVARSFEHP